MTQAAVSRTSPTPAVRPDADAIRARREELKNKYLHAPAARPASTVRGVHHLALIAKDVEETIRFYQSPFGRRLMARMPALMAQTSAMSAQRVQAHLPELIADIQPKAGAAR